MKYILYIISCVICTACAAPWEPTRSALDAMTSSINAARANVAQAELENEQRDQATRALNITEHALEVGDIATEVWEHAATPRPQATWKTWVIDALNGATAVIGILQAAGVKVPPLITIAIDALIAAIGGIQDA